MINEVKILFNELKYIEYFLLWHDLIFGRVLVYFLVHFHEVMDNFFLLDGVKFSEDDNELENSTKEVILGLLVEEH